MKLPFLQLVGGAVFFCAIGAVSADSAKDDSRKTRDGHGYSSAKSQEREDHRKDWRNSGHDEEWDRRKDWQHGNQDEDDGKRRKDWRHSDRDNDWAGDKDRKHTKHADDDRKYRKDGRHSDRDDEGRHDRDWKHRERDDDRKHGKEWKRTYRDDDRKHGEHRGHDSYFHKHGYTRLHIPPGHYPPPGECRIWYPDRPPGHQPPPGNCRRVPHGAWVIHHPHHHKDHVHVKVYDRHRPGTVLVVGEFEIGSGNFIRVVVDK